LSEKRVNRVDNVVQEGDQVKVWVRSINPSKGRIELTMIEPPAVDWNELRAGQVYTGTVKKIERYGAFVDIGATRDGLVHISEITTDYIKDPKNYVNVGDEVAVKVLKVDRKRRRIELSMKALEEHMIEEAQEEDLDDLATEMELAFRQAQESRKRREQRRRKAKARADRDEIFSRTLDLREDQE
jgi:ribosomal protein S1